MSNSFVIPAVCITGGLYLSPQAGQIINPRQPLNITWNPACFDASTTSAVDIYLFAPGFTGSGTGDTESGNNDTDEPLVHVWSDFPLALGPQNFDLDATWWGEEQEQELQLNIVAHGQPVSESELPAGPVFTARMAPRGGKDEDSAGKDEDGDDEEEDEEDGEEGKDSKGSAVSRGAGKTVLATAAMLVAPLLLAAL
ncbi:hypothetical protein CC1G_05560 [Coprinopsis cinerea okayama7|uniref:Uncharacterized protein n=1 Tax=Coprinopsis cinerea (strain Okayama-7 / 130 / ATCC MYA-4618 / FGSC 9003) TaxID=240176 RepID=A8P1E4_COPC7|nr:hypothetical protein CC1G_05560 [Coprinopsis cinerea okayama7\|eukprot:XP_001838079.1 hypothetical protein CC1G_05560 [Coprinopsis cinerea okayama7\